MPLTVECCASAVTFKKSGIAHADAGRAVFAAQPMKKGSIVRYYYGSLVYDYFSSTGSRFKTYGESVMKVTRETYLGLTNQLLETAMNRNMGHRSVRIVTALFCTIRYLNGRRYLSGDEAPVG